MQVSQAQEPRRYSFTHYSITNGLSAYHVNHLVQDERGYMWLATFDGLQRFDGTRFLTFRNNKNDSRSIPDNVVHQLLLDKQNNLWMLTGDGSIGMFDTKKMTYRKAGVKSLYPDAGRGERLLSEDSKGNLLYTLISKEVLIYDHNTNDFIPGSLPFKTPPGWKIINIVEDTVGKKYWFSSDSGIAVYNTRTGNVSCRGHNRDHEAFIDRYGDVDHAFVYMVDSKRRIWFEHWPPDSGAPFIYAFDLLQRLPVFEKYNLIPLVKRYVEPRWMIEQKDGSIWLSGLGLFLRYIEKDKLFEPVFNKYENEQSIYYDAVHHLFEDKDRNIWVPTNNNGIYVFNPAQQLFTSTRHMNRITATQGGGGLMSFVQTGSGDILAGTWGDGIYRYDKDLHVKPLAIKGLDEKKYTVWAMCRLRDKRNIWMGMQPGMIVYDELAGKGTVYNPSIFQGRTIRQIANDPSGNIWLGTQGLGVFKWIRSKAVHTLEEGFVKFKDIPDVLIEKINIDTKGFVWVCTRGQGVYKIDPATDKILEHIDTKGPPGKRLLTDEAADAFQYNDSIMILVTGGLNILNTKTGRIIHITSAEGLPSDIVMSVQKDREGYVWLGLYNGLCKMSLEKMSFTYYDRNDGMLNDNFTLAAAYQLTDGRMLFGTSDDFVAFDPAVVKPNLRPAAVTITGFRILNKSVLVDSIMQLNRVELLPEENSITIFFAGLSYFSTNKLTCYYLMEGIDKEWRKANILNQAIYNYLPPGDYTFRVKAENGEGASSDITSLKIKVKPPFWQTPWFIGLVAFVSLVVLYWIDKFRMERVKDNQRTRTSIATSLTKDMSSTLSNINVLSAMAKIKAATDIERTKDYVSQISENSNRMIEVMDDMVWSIDPENDGMQNIIARMKKYAGEIQLRYGIETGFTADPQLNRKRLAMDRRHELFLIYKEVLTNIGKHSKGKFADVHIGYEKSKIILQVMDDGKGFDIESAIYGRGLNEIRKRAVALNAKLDISSRENNGTVVRVEIPL
jgi:signal transduction histidine kinase/ligand-binding sensor domain-containing protein